MRGRGKWKDETELVAGLVRKRKGDRAKVLIAALLRKRTAIEKAFNQQEQKLDEPKAWSASQEGKRIQAIAMCIVHNLLRLFGAKLKIEEDIEDTKVIKAWQKDLGKRMEKARAAGRHLPVELYQALYRPTEVSLQFIRWYG
jgi:hypothetical protein